MIDPFRILIADDHLLFRDGLRVLLAAAPDTELVGEATNGEEAIALASQVRPDVILMDLQMPGMDGIEATRQIARASSLIGILVLTMYEDDGSVFAAMRAGARGYLLKGAKYDEVLRAVRAVANGEAIFSPTIAVRLMDYFTSIRPAATHPAFPELSAREREILDLVAQGYRNPAIADRLFLSPKTVRNHVSSIFAKLQVADRAQAIIRARDGGLGSDGR